MGKKKGWTTCFAGIPEMDAFTNGKIKVLGYARPVSSPFTVFMWSTEEEDAELTESDVDQIDPNKEHFEVIAVYKLHKIIRRGTGEKEGVKNDLRRKSRSNKAAKS